MTEKIAGMEESSVAMGGSSIPIVQMRSITKDFGATRAVDKVALDIFPGEVHGLVGENGAGKSTLVRVLAGFYADYEGQIFIRGRLERLLSPRQAIELGIALVHQELSLVPELTVAENIFLGREFRSNFPGLIDRREAESQARKILAQVDARISPTEKVINLSIAKRQLVEIAKGISMNSQVLILDEPTSSLTTPEIKDLFRVIRTLKERGTAIIYITHKLSEVLEIADQITVLRDGMKVATAAVSQWDEAKLVKAMVGRELSSFFSRSHSYAQSGVLLEVEGLTRWPYFKDVTFKVYKGEVLGIYGLVGAGRTELAEAIFGLSPYDSGTIRIKGQPIRVATPRDAIANGIVLVPEDRRILGLVLLLDVKTNLSLPILAQLCRFGFVKRKEESEIATKSVQALQIRIPRLGIPVSALSGGTQQKVVLGKWLNANPEILILDEPTKGIDVGSKAEIRRIIDHLAGEEKAIILISSELPEILGMSDRVLVMRDGMIVGEFARAECSEEILGACATGISVEHVNNFANNK